MKAKRRRGQIDIGIDFGNEMLTIEETAEKLKCSRRSIFNLFNNGLPKTKIDGIVRINPHKLAEYLDANTKVELKEAV